MTLITLDKERCIPNGFTLEELQIIHLDMTHNILKETILNVAPSYIALRDKVEAMIDRLEEKHLPRENL